MTRAKLADPPRDWYPALPARINPNKRIESTTDENKNVSSKL
jgi:hypothetical protein